MDNERNMAKTGRIFHLDKWKVVEDNVCIRGRNAYFSDEFQEGVDVKHIRKWSGGSFSN